MIVFSWKLKIFESNPSCDFQVLIEESNKWSKKSMKYLQSIKLIQFIVTFVLMRLLRLRFKVINNYDIDHEMALPSLSIKMNEKKKQKKKKHNNFKIIYALPCAAKNSQKHISLFRRNNADIVQCRLLFPILLINQLKFISWRVHFYSWNRRNCELVRINCINYIFFFLNKRCKIVFSSGRFRKKKNDVEENWKVKLN